jgi:hypothetical protein
LENGYQTCLIFKEQLIKTKRLFHRQAHFYFDNRNWNRLDLEHNLNLDTRVNQELMTEKARQVVIDMSNN